MKKNPKNVTDMGDLSKYYRIRKNLVSRRINSEIIVVPTADNPADLNYIYALRKGVEIDIWNMLKKKTKMSEIVGKISKEYSAPRHKIEKDVMKLIKVLVAEKLVTEC